MSQVAYRNVEYDLFSTLMCEKDLKYYIQQAWPIVENRRELIWNWHLDIICQHLCAVTNTYIIRAQLPRTEYAHDLTLPFINYLWVNIPPRHTKSLIASVFWPTWEWGPMNLPEVEYLFMSYAQGLSTRDSVKRRRIIESKWYQERWGDRYQITSDQNQKTRFDNNKTGHMISTSVRGLATGEGGDRVIMDDAHNVTEVESDTKRNFVIDTWDDSISTRVNDDDTGAFIGIMHRTHHKDLTGHLLSKAKTGELQDFVHLCIPARFESKHPTPSNTPLGFTDPRTVEGEVIDKGRWPEKKLSMREGRMSKWAVAGQHQQRPSPRGGDLIPVAMIQLVETYNEKHIKKLVRYWDKAGSVEDTASKTVGVLMAFMTEESPYAVLILNVVSGRWTAGKRETTIKNTARVDGPYVEVGLEQEPGSGGKESAYNTAQKSLFGYKSIIDKVSGAKEVRLEPFIAQVEHQNVACLVRGWTREYLDALEDCKIGSVTDEGDATSGAFNQGSGLIGKRRGKVRLHIMKTEKEKKEEEEEERERVANFRKLSN